MSFGQHAEIATRLIFEYAARISEDGDIDLLPFAGTYAAPTIDSERLRQDADSARLSRREVEIVCKVWENDYNRLSLHGQRPGVDLGEVSGRVIPAVGNSITGRLQLCEFPIADARKTMNGYFFGAPRPSNTRMASSCTRG